MIGVTTCANSAGASAIQLQGGLLPSEQITVVPEPCGTTTVVLLAGAAGLLLLIQPVSIGANRHRLIRILM
jgi:hypothetical protein